MKIWSAAKIGLISILIIIGLSFFTNSVNLQNKKWDFYYYIEMAKNGFAAPSLSAPFAYRYVTPLLVRTMGFINISIENGFRTIAYIGMVTQLMGIFFLAEWISKSQKGAYLAMIVTALSLFHIKFLLFDIYRPDHLAYPFILLQTYLALKRKFSTLLILTIIASQIREFTVIPLLSYLFMRMNDENRASWIKETTLSLSLLLIVLVLPRILIPVTLNFQAFDYSPKGLLIALTLPIILLLDINFYFCVFAYLLPLLFLVSPRSIKTTFIQLSKDQQRYLIAYTTLVLLLMCLGGTDLYRFATYLFLPQIILIGMVAPVISSYHIVIMLIITAIFNRLWLPFPDWDNEKYRDFYGGSALRWNVQIIYRTFELLMYLIFGYLVRKMIQKQAHTPEM